MGRLTGEQNVEAAQLAFDLAKLDLILAAAREAFRDDKLELSDVAAIRGSARAFGVTEIAAYHRARGLGLLSYQGQETTP